ncbi:MAG: type I methionyl aminopeptidase [bacterium]|nr:type I methionyl aminopeptidase [bacterium]
MQLKSKDDIRLLKISGRILVRVLKELEKKAKPGVSLLDLEKRAREIIKKYGGEPAFLGYKPRPNATPYPAAICASVNEGLVHGIPHDIPLKDGDLLKIDVGVSYKNRLTDAAITVEVGKVRKEAKRLEKCTLEALKQAIKACKPGGHIGDIGWAVEQTVKKYGYSVAEKLSGHGVGFEVHESPTVHNYGEKGEGEELVPGMVIAIEPMVITGSGEIVEKEDGGFDAKDGSLTAHFEKTIAITDRGYIDLTPW